MTKLNSVSIPRFPHLARAGGRARLASGRPSSAPPALPPAPSSPRFSFIPVTQRGPKAKSAPNPTKFASDSAGFRAPSPSGTRRSARKPIERGVEWIARLVLGRRNRRRWGPRSRGQDGRAAQRAHSLMGVRWGKDERAVLYYYNIILVKNVSHPTINPAMGESVTDVWG